MGSHYPACGCLWLGTPSRGGGGQSPAPTSQGEPGTCPPLTTRLGPLGRGRQEDSDLHPQEAGCREESGQQQEPPDSGAGRWA